jgi:NTE family protein
VKRIGLVLGGGGPLGGAWMAGALVAVAEHLGRPLLEIDTIVGTSAGSLLAAQVRCGMTPEQLVDVEIRADALQGRMELDTLLARGFPFALYPGFGSPRMLISAATAPWRAHPMAVATAVMPSGRSSLDPLAEMLDTLTAGAREQGITFHDQWPAERQTWIVATDYDHGCRTIFGQSAAPRAALTDAVVASCSVPGWFTPVRIGGTRYIDGGVCSTTSLDLLQRAHLDHIYVLAPLASLLYDRPSGLLAVVERAARRLITRQLIREVRMVRRAGTTMTLLLPGPEDLETIGHNVMDPSRRASVVQTSLRTSQAFLRKSQKTNRRGG